MVGSTICRNTYLCVLGLPVFWGKYETSYHSLIVSSCYLGSTIYFILHVNACVGKAKSRAGVAPRYLQCVEYLFCKCCGNKYIYIYILVERVKVNTQCWLTKWHSLRFYFALFCNIDRKRTKAIEAFFSDKRYRVFTSAVETEIKPSYPKGKENTHL